MSAGSEVIDVAIVGGGVAGVYTGWRLLGTDAEHLGQGGARPRITLFEQSDRTGGRLVSVTPPGMPNTTCELGGMRFMSRHVLVSWLVDQFRLPTSSMPVDIATNIAYLRGRMLRQSQLSDPDQVPYNLTELERSIVGTPNTSLFLNALQQIVPDCLDLSYEDLLQRMTTATFDGVALNELGFWNVLARILSPEGYRFVRDTCGYDCLVSNWSVADAIPFILADFGAGVTYSRLPGGYVELPRILASEFAQRGGDIQLGHSLQSFDTAPLADGRRGVVLRFTNGSIVYARQLVLAIPRRAIDLLDQSGAVLGAHRDDVRALVESVEPIPLFKIFLAYDYPWWESAGVTTGRTLTDLPIRQCYYWAVEQTDTKTKGKACVLASYDDDQSVSFWAGLRATTKATRLFQSGPPSDAPPTGLDDWERYQAPQAMVDEAHRQLMQIHGVQYAPKPYAAAYRDWEENPFGGGSNFWRIHSKSWEVIPAMINPVPGLPVFICGEAYSREQGWVEGALQTAEMVLQKHFGLTAPPLRSQATGVGALQPPAAASSPSRTT